jgi:hypothetical protein
MKPIAKEDRELNHLEGLHYAQDPWLAAHAKGSRGEAISKQEVTGPFKDRGHC